MTNKNQNEIENKHDFVKQLDKEIMKYKIKNNEIEREEKIIDVEGYYYNPNLECSCKAIFADTHKSYCKRRQRPK